MSEEIKQVIIIEVKGGCVINVSGIPSDYTYEVKDYDNEILTQHSADSSFLNDTI